MTISPDAAPSPAPDQRVSPATRATLVVLGCLALALGGAGAAYAGSLGTDGPDSADDSAWVTVVEDDAATRTVDCPKDSTTNAGTNGDGL